MKGIGNEKNVYLRQNYCPAAPESGPVGKDYSANSRYSLKSSATISLSVILSSNP